MIDTSCSHNAVFSGRWCNMCVQALVERMEQEASNKAHWLTKTLVEVIQEDYEDIIYDLGTQVDQAQDRINEVQEELNRTNDMIIEFETKCDNYQDSCCSLTEEIHILETRINLKDAIISNLETEIYNINGN